MRAQKKPQADLDKGFKSGNFPNFNRRFQKFRHRMSVLATHKEMRERLAAQAFSG